MATSVRWKDFTLVLVLLIMACSPSTMDLPRELHTGWTFRADPAGAGRNEAWYRPDADRTSWQKASVGFWNDSLESYDGDGWYAVPFRLNDTTRSLGIFFGGVDDDAEAWVNGIHVGAHSGYSEPFVFDVSPAVRTGDNLLVIRVSDHGGPGGIYKPIHLTYLDEVEKLLRTKYADMPARPSAPWVRDAVVYEVYLRSFSPEGTFRALEARLQELKDLGVTVVWLMPIHPVGELNRKGSLGSPYAVQDFYAVNPEFGTLDDFRSLVKSVHALGMHIIIDLVANHTAWDNPMLLEHPEWFTRNDEGAIVAPNSDWHDVADLNFDRHELRKYMIAMMKYWVGDVGIDGFRCDVAELVPTDFWEVARGELDKIKPVMMLSEGTLPEHHVKAFDLTYSWNLYDVLGPVLKGDLPASHMHSLIKNESYLYPRGALRLRFHTNHDKNAWDNPARVKFGPAGLRVSAALAYTLPGIPLLYNGEEVGNTRKLDLFEKVEIDWSRGKEYREFFRVLGALRARHPAVRVGSYLPVANSDSTRVVSFYRGTESDHVLVVVNVSDRRVSAEIALPEPMKDLPLMEFLSGIESEGGSRMTAKLYPKDLVIFVSRPESMP